MLKRQRTVWRLGLVVLTGLLLPTAVRAQQASGIAGVVRDTSGGVLPGVTVEAASPALIEKVRSAVTDGEGRYNISDLRPGTYVVTFSLAGFSTFKRDGVALTAGFTASVNADMKVGALEETITVSGAAPLVDTQNVKQQQSVSTELLAALPSGTGGFMGIARLIPGMSGGTDSGGASGIYSSNSAHNSTLHGKGGAKMTYDGMQTSNLSVTGHTSYVMNPATVVETVVEAGGISAESESSGILMNLVPREGANTYSSIMNVTYTTEALQSDNLSDTLRERGVTAVAHVLRLYDANFAGGGPVKRDRLWFFTASRFSGNKNEVQGIYFNATRGTPFYTPDLGQPAYRKEWLKSLAGRMTWQASGRNKINGFADVQSYQVRGRGGVLAPEAQTVWSFWPDGLYQVTWNSVATNRFLLEGGASLTKNGYPYTREQVTDIFGFTVAETDISILEAASGLRYNAKNDYSTVNIQDRYAERFSATYSTGSHVFKTGVQLQQHIHDQDTIVNQDVRYTFLSGVPTQITQTSTPHLRKNRTKPELGIFAQDRWTINRLTLNYGLRFDYFNGSVPAQDIPARRFVGAAHFDKVEGVPRWTDLNPRVGASYDLFGNGRTALKTSLGRYVGKMSLAYGGVTDVVNPVNSSVNATNRSWTDLNRDYVPNCNLANFSANGECGPIDNVNFGQLNPNAIRYDDDLTRGFGTRDYFWDVTAEVQHELLPGTSTTVGYYRNWTDHFNGAGVLSGSGANFGWPSGHVDNSALAPVDFQPYCIKAPIDARLPGGGGYQVCGLYDVVPAKFGTGKVAFRRASNFDRPDGGKGKSLYSDFVTVSINSRIGTDTTIGASVDTGRTVVDQCFVVDSPQELLFCRVVKPFSSQTQVKINGNYELPGGFSVSGVVQNLSGIPYNANYAARNNEIRSSLGRNLAACGTRVVCTASVTVPLVAPWTLFEPRRTLVDMRMSKSFSVGPRTRLRLNVDIYNLLNDSSLVGINQTYGPDWQKPVAGPFDPGLVDGRLFQVGGQVTF